MKSSFALHSVPICDVPADLDPVELDPRSKSTGFGEFRWIPVGFGGFRWVSVGFGGFRRVSVVSAFLI